MVYDATTMGNSKVYICITPISLGRLWKILDSSAFVTVDEEEICRDPPEVWLLKC